MLLLLGGLAFLFGGAFVAFPSRIDALKQKLNRRFPRIFTLYPVSIPIRTRGWLAMTLGVLLTYAYFVHR